MPREVKARLSSVIDRVNDLKEKSTKIVKIEGKEVPINTEFTSELNQLNKEFNTLVHASKPWTTSLILEEVLSASYIMMLSGPMTFFRAGTGGYTSGLFEAMVFMASNPKYFKTFMKELITSAPAAYNRAVISRKTGIDYFGPNSFKGDDFSGSKTGRFENYILRGLGDAYKKGGKASIITKSVGQAFKVIHSLGALDTFMNTLAGNAAGAVLEKKSGKNTGTDAMLEVYKEIAREDFKDFKEDVSNEVDLLIESEEIKPENRTAEIESLLKKRMGLTGSRMSPESVYTTNRAQELRENMLSDKLEQSISMAKEASLMGKPDGIVGLMVETYQKNTSMKPEDEAIVAIGKFISNSVFRFARLTAQYLNKSINYIPVLGVATSMFGKGWDPISEQWSKGYGFDKYRSNPALAHQRIAKNIAISIATALLLGDSFDFGDEDDDTLTRAKNLFDISKWKLSPNRTFDIRLFGNTGRGGYSKNKKIDPDWENISISWKKDENGNFINGSYVPLKLNAETAAMAASVGTFTDLFKEFDTDAQNQKNQNRKESGFISTFSKMANNNLSISTEGSFSSFGKAYKAFSKEEDFTEGVSAVVYEIASSNLSSIINPAVFAQVTQEIQAANNIPKTESKTFIDRTIRNMYGLDAMFSPINKDVFGIPIKEKAILSDYKMTEEEKKTNDLLYKFPGESISINKQDFSGMRKDKDLTGFNFGGVKYKSNDNKIAEEAQEFQEKNFKSMILADKYYNYLMSLDNKELMEKRIKSKQKKSVENAKVYIINKYRETGEIEKLTPKQ